MGLENQVVCGHIDAEGNLSGGKDDINRTQKQDNHEWGEEDSAEFSWGPGSMRERNGKQDGEERLGTFYFILKSLKRDLRILCI